MFSDFIATLILDVILVVVTWGIITIVWNNIIRKELKVRNDLVWAWLLGIVAAIANAGVIAYRMLVPGGSMFWSLASVLLGEVGLVTITWLLIAGFWNNVVREELKVMNNITWVYLLGIAVAIYNAAAIAYLLQ